MEMMGGIGAIIVEARICHYQRFARSGKGTEIARNTDLDIALLLSLNIIEKINRVLRLLVPSPRGERVAEPIDEMESRDRIPMPFIVRSTFDNGPDMLGIKISDLLEPPQIVRGTEPDSPMRMELLFVDHPSGPCELFLDLATNPKQRRSRRLRPQPPS